MIGVNYVKQAQSQKIYLFGQVPDIKILVGRIGMIFWGLRKKAKKLKNFKVIRGNIIL
jgi:hypothetical protein